MKAEVIKPKKEMKEARSLLNPIIYLVLGILLIFKSNEVVELLFYVLGIIVIIYGIKSFVLYYQNKDVNHCDCFCYYWRVTYYSQWSIRS